MSASGSSCFPSRLFSAASCPMQDPAVTDKRGHDTSRLPFPVSEPLPGGTGFLSPMNELVGGLAIENWTSRELQKREQVTKHTGCSTSDKQTWDNGKVNQALLWETLVPKRRQCQDQHPGHTTQLAHIHPALLPWNLLSREPSITHSDPAFLSTGLK